MTVFCFWSCLPQFSYTASIAQGLFAFHCLLLLQYSNSKSKQWKVNKPCCTAIWPETIHLVYHAFIFLFLSSFLHRSPTSLSHSHSIQSMPHLTALPANSTHTSPASALLPSCCLPVNPHPSHSHFLLPFFFSLVSLNSPRPCRFHCLHAQPSTTSTELHNCSCQTTLCSVFLVMTSTVPLVVASASSSTNHSRNYPRPLLTSLHSNHILLLSSFLTEIYLYSTSTTLLHHAPIRSHSPFSFNSFLSFAATTPHEFIITGNFNIHLDNPRDHLTSQFLSLLSTFNLSKHINLPTHNKFHILDLIITSSDSSLVPSVSSPYWSHQITTLFSLDSLLTQPCCLLQLFTLSASFTS